MCLTTNSLQEKRLVYMPIPQPELGKLIKETRKTNKLSQKELGERVGVSHQTIANWEKLRVPTDENLKQLATVLDKPDDFFFRRTPKEEIPPRSFCENLRACRKRCGKTQIQLSEETGISLVTIKAYEDSSSGLFVTEADLQQISNIIGVAPEELLGISLTAETLHDGLRENYINQITESMEKLNIMGLERAVARISEITTHRRYQK